MTGLGRREGRASDDWAPEVDGPIAPANWARRFREQPAVSFKPPPDRDDWTAQTPPSVKAIKAIGLMIHTYANYVTDERKGKIAGADAWPSLDALADRTGYSKRNVARCIDVLLSTGWLRQVRSGQNVGRAATSNGYELVWPSRWELSTGAGDDEAA